jgi:hypothetical protein
MNAKHASEPPASDPSLAATREVDAVSLLAAELLLNEHDDAQSGRRRTAAGAELRSPSSSSLPVASTPPPPASLRDSLLPDEPSRFTRTVAFVGGAVAVVVLGAVAAYVASR